MKKNLLNPFLVATIVLLPTGSVLAQHEAPTRSEAVPLVKVYDIVIDGVADETSWGAAMDTWEKFNSAGVTSDADFSGSLRLCWDWDNLYLFVNITDDVECSYTGIGDSSTFDCIEVLLDLDTAITNGNGAYIGDELQLRFNRGWNEYTGSQPRNGVTYEFTQISNPSDWQLEAKLPWLGFFPDETTETLHDWFDKAIGFDVTIVDNDSAGRDGQFAWDADDTTGGTTEDNAWKDTRVFGVIHLFGCPAGGCGASQNKVEFTLQSIEFFNDIINHKITLKNIQDFSSIEIISSCGRGIMKIPVNASEHTVDTSGLTPGYYIMRMCNSNKCFIEKFILN